MIEFQRKLLDDGVRNDALFRALKAVITPGCTVTDIGSGTGFLSFLALGLGAKHCTLYETSHDLLKLSKHIASENRLQHQCTFLNAHSRDIRSPMKTDIVISETIGNFAYEEHIIENMNDAKRFLKPGGILIPQKLRQYIAPFISEKLWKEINIWNGIGYNLNLVKAKEVALNNMYVKRVRPNDLLKNSTQEWDAIDFTKKNSSQRKGKMTWTLPRTTPIYGFAVWWECDLVPGITLSTSPFRAPTHWEQIFLPLLSPIQGTKGDHLSCTITSDSNERVGLNVTWHTILSRKNRRMASQKQEIQKGMIFP